MLEHYVSQGRSFRLPGVRTNLSGITYNRDTGTYFLIQNGGAHLYEYSGDLRTKIRQLRLTGAHSDDFEAIAHLGGSEFAVATEINHILVFHLPDYVPGEVLSLDPADPGVQELVLPPRRRWNKGIEALCFDPDGNAGTGTFYALQEKAPRMIFRFHRPTHSNDLDYADGSLQFDHPFDAEIVFDGVATDLSGCEFDRRTGRLLIISHQSSKVVEVTLDGQIVGELRLPGIWRGGAAQYEGIALGPLDALSVVSEPLFGTWPSRAAIYRFGAPSRSSHSWGRQSGSVSPGNLSGQ
jgi:uncharacterized protein YjiK